MAAEHVTKFFETYTPYALKVQEKYGIPASVTLGQAAYESGWGRSRATTKANNYFGIKSHNWGGPIYVSSTKEEDKSGRVYTTTAAFRKYGSAAESFDNYGEFLTVNPRYKNAFNQSDPYAFLKEVAKAGYGTDSTYYKDVSSIMNKYNLTRLDTGGGGGAPLPTEGNPPEEKKKSPWSWLFPVNPDGSIPGVNESIDVGQEPPAPGETTTPGFDTGGWLLENGARIGIILLLTIVVIVAVFSMIKGGTTPK